MSSVPTVAGGGGGLRGHGDPRRRGLLVHFVNNIIRILRWLLGRDRPTPIAGRIDSRLLTGHHGFVDFSHHITVDIVITV